VFQESGWHVLDHSELQSLGLMKELKRLEAARPVEIMDPGQPQREQLRLGLGQVLDPLAHRGAVDQI